MEKVNDRFCNKKSFELNSNSEENKSLFDVLQIFIETKGLTMIPVCMEYVDDIYDSFQDEKVFKFLSSIPSNISKVGVMSWILKAKESMFQRKAIKLVILEKTTCKYLGSIGLNNIDTKTPEIGIHFNVNNIGKGYGTQALTAIIQWSFEHLNIDYIIFNVDETNERSIKLVNKFNSQIQDGKEIFVKKDGTKMTLLKYFIYK